MGHQARCLAVVCGFLCATPVAAEEELVRPGAVLPDEALLEQNAALNFEPAPPTAPVAVDQAWLLQELARELGKLGATQQRLSELILQLEGTAQPSAAPRTPAATAPATVPATVPATTLPSPSEPEIPIAPVAAPLVPGASPLEDRLAQSAEELYREGRARFEQRNYFEAEQYFRAFVDTYPEHEYAAGARYWLAEILFEQGQFREAIEQFEWQLADVASPWRLRAQLKTGYAWFELGEYGLARRHLERARDEEPGSRISRLAQLRLDRLERIQ